MIKLSHKGRTVIDHKSNGTSVEVKKQSDGTWYGDTGEFDFERSTEAEMVATLVKWGFTEVAATI